jgi:hypothetical protein
MQERETTGAGLPLKERSPEMIRQALAGRDERIIESAIRAAEYARQQGLGVTALAHQCRIPGGTLSQFFAGLYTGVESNIADRLDDFFQRLLQKELYGDKRAYCETRIATALHHLADKVRVIRRIQLLRSPEQCGKTTALRHYTAENNSGRTVMIEVPGGGRTGGFGDFVWALAEQLDIPYSVKLREKRIRIRQALSSCDLVIIDEAHLIWTWTDRDIAQFLDYLRTDVFANGARGVLLVETNSDALDQLSRFKRRAGYNVGQLIGRMRNDVVRIDPADDITVDDVAALVGRYYRPGADMLGRLVALAQQEGLGHLGLLLDVVNEAWSRAKAERRDLDDATVGEVARETMAQLKQREKLYAH